MKIIFRYITVLLFVLVGSMQCIAEEIVSEKTFSIRNNSTQSWTVENKPLKGHIQFILGCSDSNKVDGPCKIQPLTTALFLFQGITSDNVYTSRYHETIGQFIITDYKNQSRNYDISYSDQSICHNAEPESEHGRISHKEDDTPPLRLNWRSDDGKTVRDEDGNIIIAGAEWPAN